MPQGSESLADIMAEEEARRLAEARAEIAAEKRAWDAMNPAEQAEVIAKREAKFADVPDIDEGDDLDDEDDGDEGDDE